MSELGLQIISIVKVLWIVPAVSLYAFGGMSGKWKRRYLCPLWMMLGIVIFSQPNFSWWFLLYFPLLVGSLSLGYGAETLTEKFRKRLVYGLAVGFTTLPIAIVTHQWWLFGLHTALCVTFSLLLGLNNPTSARTEETLMSLGFLTIPLFMIGG